jgi:hypothetical protein
MVQHIFLIPHRRGEDEDDDLERPAVVEIHKQGAYTPLVVAIDGTP